MNKRLIRTSKFLSLVLRHKPETVGITLDPEGWIEIDRLLAACAAHGRPLTRETLERVVTQNDKQRFVIRDGRIRANQGHSIPINLGLTAHVPPDELFHGTAERFLEAILAQGLLKMRRQHVHLSSDVETAQRVGGRHGRPVVLRVQAAAMYSDGFAFYLSENSVWLTDHVPPKYLHKKCR